MHVQVFHASNTFIDDLFMIRYMYLMKYKSVTFEEFKEFRQEVEKQLGKSIKVLRLDRSGEYLNLEFHGYLRDKRILSQWMNRILLDIVRSIIKPCRII